MRRQRDPLRMARGSTYQGQSAGTYTTQGVYNDSTGAELIVVWSMVLAAGSGSTLAASGVRQGPLANLVGHGTSLLTGQAARVGTMCYESLAAVPASDGTYAEFANTSTAFTGFRHPIAVLQPGWTFLIAALTQNSDIRTSLFWEVIHYEDLLESVHCPICDVVVTVQ